MNKVFIGLVCLFVSGYNLVDVKGTPTTRIPTIAPTTRIPTIPTTIAPTSASSNSTVILTLTAINCLSTICNLNTIIMDNYQSICSTNLPTPFDSCGRHSNNKNVIFKVYYMDGSGVNRLLDTYVKTYFRSSSTNLVTTYTFMNMLMDLKLRPVVLDGGILSEIFGYDKITVTHFGINSRSSTRSTALFTSVNLYLIPTN